MTSDQWVPVITYVVFGTLSVWLAVYIDRKLDIRLGRARFFWRSMVCMTAIFGAILIYVYGIGADAKATLAIVVAAAVISIGGYYMQTRYVSQRLRDVGWSPWFGLLVLVPVVSLLTVVGLFFVPGKIGRSSMAEHEILPPGETPYEPASLLDVMSQQVVHSIRP